MKETLLYQKLDNNSVRCNLCYHRCVRDDEASDEKSQPIDLNYKGHITGEGKWPINFNKAYDPLLYVVKMIHIRLFIWQTGLNCLSEEASKIIRQKKIIYPVI